MNIDLDVDEEVVRKVRKIAMDRDTTLTDMVRDYLIQVAGMGTIESKARAMQLEDSFHRLSRDMGTRKWTREDLHAR